MGALKINELLKNTLSFLKKKRTHFTGILLSICPQGHHLYHNNCHHSVKNSPSHLSTINIVKQKPSGGPVLVLDSHATQGALLSHCDQYVTTVHGPQPAGPRSVVLSTLSYTGQEHRDCVYFSTEPNELGRRVHLPPFPFHSPSYSKGDILFLLSLLSFGV